MTRTLSLFSLALIACGTSGKGELGLIAFQDLQIDADDLLTSSAVDRAFAVDSLAQIGILVPDVDTMMPLSVEVLDTDVFQVVEDGPVILLRAVGVGDTMLEVMGSDGTFDRLRIEAAEIGTVELVPTRDAHWIDDYAPSSIIHSGFAIRPGAAMGLAAELYDPSGSRISGSDVLTFSSDADLSFDTMNVVANGAVMTAGLTADGETTVITDYGGSFDLTLIDAEAPVSLTLYTPEPDEPVEIEEITGESGTFLIGALLFDDDAHLVIAAEDAEMTSVVVDGPADLFTMRGYSQEFYGFAATGCPGTGIVRLIYGGATREVPVTITDSGLDVGCD